MPNIEKTPPQKQAFSGQPDAFFDAEFSLGINEKMRVPEKILINSNPARSGDSGASDVFNDPAIVAVKKATDLNLDWMHVPERILVAGGESHISTRQPLPELKLEQTLLGMQNTDQFVQLNTPPRTLRVEDTAPAFDAAIKQLNKSLKSVNRNNTNSKMNDSMVEFDDPDLHSQNTNVVLLRRRLLHLQQRLDSLEMDNNSRKKRDMLLYTIGIIYILFKGINWFASKNRISYL